MELAVIGLLIVSVAYLLYDRARIEEKNADEVERIDSINNNLRLYIRELEKDIDKLCAENKTLSDQLKR